MFLVTKVELSLLAFLGAAMIATAVATIVVGVLSYSLRRVRKSNIRDFFSVAPDIIQADRAREMVRCMDSLGMMMPVISLWKNEFSIITFTLSEDGCEITLLFQEDSVSIKYNQELCFQTDYSKNWKLATVRKVMSLAEG